MCYVFEKFKRLDFYCFCASKVPFVHFSNLQGLISATIDVKQRVGTRNKLISDFSISTLLLSKCATIFGLLSNICLHLHI